MTNLRQIGTLLLAGLLFAAGAACAGDTGTVRKASALKDEPYRDAKTIAVLPPGDSVEIVTRLRGWFEVRGAKGKGWVRMLDIRRGQARAGTIDSNELVALASGRAGTGQVVASTGIRGLSEQELKSARYNEAELRKLDSFRTTRPVAASLAAKSGLVARKIK